MEDVELVEYEKLDGCSLRDKMLALCGNPQNLEMSQWSHYLQNVRGIKNG